MLGLLFCNKKLSNNLLLSWSKNQIFLGFNVSILRATPSLQNNPFLFFILERLFAKTTCSFSFLRAKYVFILLLTRALKNIYIYIVYTYIIHNTFFKKYIRIQDIKMYIYFNILVSLSIIIYVSQRFPPKWKYFFPSLVFNVQHMIAASAFMQYGKWVLRYLMELTN